MHLNLFSNKKKERIEAMQGDIVLFEWTLAECKTTTDVANVEWRIIDTMEQYRGLEGWDKIMQGIRNKITAKQYQILTA